ncbi:hypothetical protein [Flavobacterium aestivum]|uniref:hypothetical protein n=1 Tax=Flavobacterium aestivum TaxID=3003257 RepID=UPI002483288D|nr:hypothetical protein [Flavobacterium aestivum]
MKIYQNNLFVWLLIWETNPKKRNLNNKVTFYSDAEIRVGDIIISNPGDTSVSSYEVLEIIENRKGNVKGKIHYACLVKWCVNTVPFFKGKDLEFTGKAFVKLVNG